MVSKRRMIELWTNGEETEFGIRIAGEPGFKAVTTKPPEHNV